VDLCLVHNVAQLQRKSAAAFGLGNFKACLLADMFGAGNHVLVRDIAHGGSSCQSICEWPRQSSKRPAGCAFAALDSHQLRRAVPRGGPASSPSEP
jgi:hypothetical protein